MMITYTHLVAKMNVYPWQQVRMDNSWLYTLNVDAHIRQLPLTHIHLCTAQPFTTTGTMDTRRTPTTSRTPSTINLSTHRLANTLSTALPPPLNAYTTPSLSSTHTSFADTTGAFSYATFTDLYTLIVFMSYKSSVSADFNIKLLVNSCSNTATESYSRSVNSSTALATTGTVPPIGYKPFSADEQKSSSTRSATCLLAMHFWSGLIKLRPRITSLL
ncbi:hypothetical protein BpHYR1_016325 [Brachionus plicatilis]|uniref:Uncharacterized protein n=1 Tax=Brachionus plicatilis TaxID=10195 RepID=A0A3M7SUA4_BRAPC|nr:hypothetical protein BpHYR1_016325 [Brachionus plicatilis]